MIMLLHTAWLQDMAWKAMRSFGEDVHSRGDSFNVPGALLYSLEKKQPNPDGSQMMSPAARFGTRAGDALTGRPVPARLNRSGGPRP